MCIRDRPFFVFEEQEFTVTGEEQEPTPAPTETQTPSPAPTQTQTPARQAPAATAVQGQPRFTG